MQADPESGICNQHRLDLRGDLGSTANGPVVACCDDREGCADTGAISASADRAAILGVGAASAAWFAGDASAQAFTTKEIGQVDKVVENGGGGVGGGGGGGGGGGDGGGNGGEGGEGGSEGNNSADLKIGSRADTDKDAQHEDMEEGKEERKEEAAETEAGKVASGSAKRSHKNSSESSNAEAPKKLASGTAMTSHAELLEAIRRERDAGKRSGEVGGRLRKGKGRGKRNTPRADATYEYMGDLLLASLTSAAAPGAGAVGAGGVGAGAGTPRSASWNISGRRRGEDKRAEGMMDWLAGLVRGMTATRLDCMDRAERQALMAETAELVVQMLDKRAAEDGFAHRSEVRYDSIRCAVALSKTGACAVFQTRIQFPTRCAR
ncbi:unnamed protein product [Closterium sp. NIES-54]